MKYLKLKIYPINVIKNANYFQVFNTLYNFSINSDFY